MPLTQREKILQNRVAVLQSITTGNGYATTVNSVARLLTNPLAAGLPFPLCILHDIDEVALPPGQGTAVNFLYRRLGLVVEFWMQETSKGSISADLNALLGDVIKAFQADYSCGGLAEDTELAEMVTVLSEQYEPMGGMQVRFEIQYRFLFGDPTSG